MRSRATILEEAGRLATVEGIEGLSIGRLAHAVGISKSGLFAHFGSKEELQLATVEAASVVFAEQVTGPADRAPTGLERLNRLVENFLGYVGGGSYPGGCFFASVAAELGARSGPVRDSAVTTLDAYFERLVAAVRDAQAEGSLADAEDPEQLAFEIDGYLLLANLKFVLSGDPAVLDRARRAFERRIAARSAAGDDPGPAVPPGRAQAAAATRRAQSDQPPS
jgi:AcrR family transcriptional regulator